MDTLTKQRRSWNMSRIKSSDTRIELLFRKTLFMNGIRYRINGGVYGKPDMVIKGKKVAIFLNGCFWHHHRYCKLAYLPKSNIKYWNDKFRQNIKRDGKVQKYLNSKGWHVIRVWECDIEKNLTAVVSKTINQIKQYD